MECPAGARRGMAGTGNSRAGANRWQGAKDYGIIACMNGNERTRRREDIRREVSVAACDTEALVRVSAQFAELELEFARRSDVTAAQLAAEKADWAAVGAAMGRVYQALCDQDNEGALAGLREIEAILTKRGVLVPQPILHTPQEGAPHAGE